MSLALFSAASTMRFTVLSTVPFRSRKSASAWVTATRRVDSAIDSTDTIQDRLKSDLYSDGMQLVIHITSHHITAGKIVLMELAST